MSYDEWKCPDCEGPMVARKGSYGIFWGCKSYPICKGTRDANGLSRAERAVWKKQQQEKEELPGKGRCYNDDRKDRELLEELDREVSEHDLKEGQKCSFKKG